MQKTNKCSEIYNKFRTKVRKSQEDRVFAFVEVYGNPFKRKKVFSVAGF